MKKLLAFTTIALMLGVAPYAVAGDGSDPADVHTPECADVQAQAQDAAGDLDAAVPWDGYNRRLFKARKLVKRALWKREITRDCASCIEAPFVHNVAVDDQETCGPLVECPCDVNIMDAADYPDAVCETAYDDEDYDVFRVYQSSTGKNSFVVANHAHEFNYCGINCDPGPCDQDIDGLTVAEMQACARDLVSFAENELKVECDPLPDFVPPPP